MSLTTLELRGESDYLREQRVMRSRQLAPKGLDRMTNSFEAIKVLGKGSFGVVRLVREKAPYPALPAICHKDVFAMKVIRKTDMLWNGQEGHLWAERDFLVRSEGSRWYVLPNTSRCVVLDILRRRCEVQPTIQSLHLQPTNYGTNLPRSLNYIRYDRFVWQLH